MASSSSSPQQNAESGPFTEFERSKSPVPGKIYDAFINHRGPDVKQTVGKALYHYLEEKGFRAFLDDEVFELGDPIIPTIRNAICSSLVQIAIFSPQYAQSSWCLDELILMLETEARLIPVFCDVEPSDLRYPEKGVYAQAFAEHKKKGRFSEEKLHQWKAALSSSSYVSGYRFRVSDGDVQMLCTELAFSVQKEVEKTIYLDVAKHPVGLDELVKDFERQIGHERNVVGIFAMGGAGKTTLAKAFFNRERSKYDRSSFLPNVREASVKDELPSLQSRLLRDLFSEDKHFEMVDEGIPILRNRMGRAKNRFLIVLDDVDHREQLDALLFRNNVSLVIVTTQDEKVLTNAGITIHYRLSKMKAAHAKELFCLNAFGLQKPPEVYETLVRSFVDLCGGLPLSIVVSAGNLFGESKVEIWNSELEKFRSTLDKDIKKRLKISIDRLEEDQQKIFMDIACFFIGKLKRTCIRIWEASGWKHAEHTIRTLTDKCLIEMQSGNSWDACCFEDPLVFKMHDHLRDLGREMAEQHSSSSPRRLWHPQDVKLLEKGGLKNLLAETKKIKIRCFSSISVSSLNCQITYFLGNSDDHGETSTDLLWIKLDCHDRKLEGIPSWIPLRRLQGLEISGEGVGRLWREDGEVPSQLKELLIKGAQLSQFTNQMGMLNNLEDLVLEGWPNVYCPKIVSIDGTSLFELLGKLSNLRRLSLRNLRVYRKLILSMPKLRSVAIKDVHSPSKVMISGEYCPSLEIVLDSMPYLNEVHLGLVKSMKSLKLSNCRGLRSVSGNLDQGKLEELIILDCPQLQEFPGLALLSYLGYIKVKDSPKLLLNGNEDLEEIEYLHLSNGQYSRIQYVSNRGLKLKILCRTMSNGGIRNLIQRLKSLPSKASTLIGRAIDGAESILNKGLFSGIITSVDAVIDFAGRKSDDSESSEEMSHSAIIICILIQTSSEKESVCIRFGPDNTLYSFPENISCTLDKGEWIVTIVLTGPKNLDYAHIDYPLMLVSGGKKKKVCTVKVKKGEEGSGLSVVKKIVDELYKESTSGA